MTPAAHAHVAARVEARARIEHVDVAQQQIGRLLRSVDERLRGHQLVDPTVIA